MLDKSNVFADKDNARSDKSNALPKPKKTRMQPVAGRILVFFYVFSEVVSAFS